MYKMHTYEILGKWIHVCVGVCSLVCVHVEARGQLPPLFKLILLSRLAGYYAPEMPLFLYPRLGERKILSPL